MTRSDSPQSQKTVIDSHQLLADRYASVRPLGGVSQVPRLICRCPLSPTTPESPTAARARCFTVGIRLRHIRKHGHSQLRHEAESGSLTLRLTPSPHGASTAGSPRHPPDRLHGERAITKVSTFQLTRSTRLNLAHRITRIYANRATLIGSTIFDSAHPHQHAFSVTKWYIRVDSRNSRAVFLGPSRFVLPRRLRPAC